MEAALPSMKSVTERGPGDNEPGLRPPIDETGGDADASFWARPVDQLRGQKNALLHILVNNTGQPLTRVDFEYNDSGKWYEEPPAGIGAVSTAVWASCGAAGPLGISTGTCGAVVFRAPGEFDVVLAYSRPVLGDDKVGGGVFAGGFVTAQKLSRKATPGHNSSRCSYDRLVDTMQMASPQVRAHKGVHIAWHGAAELPGSFPQHRKWGVRCAVFVLSDEPPQIEKLLRPLIQKAKRSMLVRVENHTLLPLRKRGEKSPSGQWRTEAPDVIPGETSTIFATESTGGGRGGCEGGRDGGCDGGGAGDAALGEPARRDQRGLRRGQHGVQLLAWPRGRVGRAAAAGQLRGLLQGADGGRGSARAIPPRKGQHTHGPDPRESCCRRRQGPGAH